MNKTFSYVLIPIVLGSVAWALWTNQQHVELKEKTDQLTTALDSTYQIIKEQNNVIIQDLKWEAESVAYNYHHDERNAYIQQLLDLLDTLEDFNNGKLPREQLRAVYQFVDKYPYRKSPYDTTSLTPLLSRQLLLSLKYPVVSLCDNCGFSTYSSLFMVGAPLEELSQIIEGDTFRVQIQLMHNALTIEPIYELMAT
ncbi:MAG: hypothetical protein AAFV80_15990, partial [Bacteroidota bacterium]